MKQRSLEHRGDSRRLNTIKALGIWDLVSTRRGATLSSRNEADVAARAFWYPFDLYRGSHSVARQLPRSAPLDYFLCGHIKSCFYQSAPRTKVYKILGNAKKFFQHEGNGFRSWQLTFEKQIPLLLYGFCLNSTISIKFQFFGQNHLLSASNG